MAIDGAKQPENDLHGHERSPVCKSCVFRANLTTDSDAKRPPNPIETIH
jgi:hypothetical protein